MNFTRLLDNLVTTKEGVAMLIIIRRLLPVLCLLCAVAAWAHDLTANAAWKAFGDIGAVPKVRAVAVDGETLFALCDKGLLLVGKDGKAVEILPADQVKKVHALAMTPQGLLVGGGDGIARLDVAGKTTKPFELKPAPAAYDRVLFDGQGSIYVYEQAGSRLRVYAPDGHLRWQTLHVYDLPDTLSAPEAVACRASGDIYLADAENNRILKFTADGQFLGRVPDNFCRPHGLAELPDGRLAVLQDYTERIDAPLITLLDAQDIPVADWVSDQRVVSTARPVFFSYGLSYYQKMGDHPPRPKESLSPLSCCAVAGGRLVVGQSATGSLRAIDPTAFGPKAAYPARARRITTQAITTGKAGYTLQVGGTLDWTNTTRSDTHSGYTRTPIFMADDSYTIANDGKTPVVNPHFAVNGQGDYFDAAHIRNAIVPPGAKMTNLEKAFAVYNFVANKLGGTNWIGGAIGVQSQYYPYTWWGLKEQGIHLTSKWNNFGAPGACGCYSAFVVKLARDLGLPARHGGVVGHVPSFVMVDGKEVYLDSIIAHSSRNAGLGIFCPLIDDQGYAGYEEITHDQYLILRVTDNPRDLHIAGLFGAKERHQMDAYDKPAVWITHQDTSKMALTLRPGETITRRFAYLGRSATEPALLMDALVNGDITYRPNLTDGTYKYGATDETNVAVKGGVLRPTAPEAAITFTMACPHPLLNGTVKIAYLRASAADGLEMDINIGGRGWERLWRASHTGRATEVIYLWPLDGLRDRSDTEWMLPAFNYAVRLRMKSTVPGQSLAVQGLMLSSLFQTFYGALPNLEVGKNVVTYEDETPGPHRVTVTHRWKESAFCAEPLPPALPTFPRDGATVKGYEFTFKWPAGADPAGGAIVDYEIDASKRPDFMWPIAPNFRNYTRGKTEDPVINYSLLTEGVRYYWRVRCQNDKGVWGPWSKTWTFTCVGPRVPRDVKIRREGRTWVLSWAPNPGGMRPAKYEIFADSAPGFMPIVTKWNTYEEDRRKRFDKPSNIILTTDKTEAVVVAEGQPNLDRAFFRVAAIDAEGSRSGPSGFVEAKHPFIFTNPVTTAKVGQPYAYQARSLWSLGGFVEGSPGIKRPHQDTIRFALKQAPAWLKVDAVTGLLSGAPTTAGTVEVTLEVTDGRDGADTQQFRIIVSP
ncbi:MAG: putative Ig domain-containing protein [Armatimonadota bacterium]